MDTGWKFAITSLPVSLGLVIGAYLWAPPGKVVYEMRRALVTQDALDIRIQAVIQGELLQGDLIIRESASTLLRLSYPPFSLINNQWITFAHTDTQHTPSPLREVGEIVQLIKRLPSIQAEGMRFRRYEFVFNDRALSRVYPILLNGTGEIWFPERETLPRWMLLRLPFAGLTQELSFNFTYDDRFNGGAPRSMRSVSDILAQLQAMQGSEKITPQVLPLLGKQENGPVLSDQDFDHDQLHDIVEPFYGTDPANPDTDNDTVLDGVEVSAGNDPQVSGVLEKNSH